jgi:endonuclease/exonuclease/phosphatase family metal-dependent hydrolase
MDEYVDIEPSQCIFYHPLCELNESEIRPNSQERILSRRGIKLLTYNIFLRPPPVNNNENDWKDERLEDFCKVLHSFDIICLQEMFGSLNSRKQSLIRAATKAGFFFYIDTSSPGFISKYMVDGGLLILSRFPIISYSFCPFRYGVIADSLAEKGLLYAKILVKDSFLHLFTTHLQASYFYSGETHFKVSCETRMAQINQISYMMSEILKSEYNSCDKILLVGDFNVDAMRYYYKKPVFIIIFNCINIAWTKGYSLNRKRI